MRERGSSARDVRLLEVSISTRRQPTATPLSAVLAVVETEDIVVHVEVLRVGRSRHEKEHLAELERVGLTLNLDANRETSSSRSVSALPFVATAVATVRLRVTLQCSSASRSDLEITRDKDEDTRCGLGAVDGLDGVLDGLERQADELLNDRLGAAESLALERQQRGGLLREKRAAEGGREK